MNIIEVFTYMEFIRKMTRQEITKERLSLLRLINGDCFFPLDVWPKSTVYRFFKRSRHNGPVPIFLWYVNLTRFYSKLKKLNKYTFSFIRHLIIKKTLLVEFFKNKETFITILYVYF